MNEKPILRKRKHRQKSTKYCQQVIDDGLYTGIVKTCGRIVKEPNRFLCLRCLRNAESEEQTVGYRR